MIRTSWFLTSKFFAKENIIYLLEEKILYNNFFVAEINHYKFLECSRISSLQEK